MKKQTNERSNNNILYEEGRWHIGTKDNSAVIRKEKGSNIKGISNSSIKY